MSQSLTFENYVYALKNGSLNIANENYDPYVPMSFALSVFNQDQRTTSLFNKNSSLVNSNDELSYADYSSNTQNSIGELNNYYGDLSFNFTFTEDLNGDTFTDLSGSTFIDTSGQDLQIVFNGGVYNSTLDDSSQISYAFTSQTDSSGNVSANYDVSGNFSATINDVTLGEFIIYSDGFTYSGTTTEKNGDQLTVEFPLSSNDINATRIHAVSISSNVTYVADPQLIS